MKRKLKNNTRPRIKVVFKQAENITDIEIQERWDRIFDLLLKENKNLILPLVE